MNHVEVDLFAALMTSRLPMLLTLAKCGFFDVRNGSVTVYFGSEGTIKKIEKHNVISFT